MKSPLKQVEDLLGIEIRLNWGVSRGRFEASHMDVDLGLVFEIRIQQATHDEFFWSIQEWGRGGKRPNKTGCCHTVEEANRKIVAYLTSLRNEKCSETN